MATAEYCVHAPGCKDIWLQLLEDLDVLEQQWVLTMSSSWVKGHAGVFGNVRADRAAGRGAAGEHLRDTARSECALGGRVTAWAPSGGAAAARQRARVAATGTPGSARCNRNRATARSSADTFRSAIGTVEEKVDFLAERSELTVVHYNPETTASEERRLEVLCILAREGADVAILLGTQVAGDALLDPVYECGFLLVQAPAAAQSGPRASP